VPGRWSITPADYEAIHEFLERNAGIRLGAGKEYLVTSRLGRLLRAHGLTDFPELVKQLRAAGSRQLQVAVVDAMTTNETFWFRDPVHYRILTEVVEPQTAARGLRIWSAACSTGQEPYTLAMVLQEARAGRGPIANTIIGTDISTLALAQARQGRYCGLSAARGLTDQQRQRYFEQHGDCLDVRPEYRRGVEFREFNLLRPFETLGRFDVVFCRNVLIYFSAERKRDILERIARVLNPGGHLFLGSTESINGHGDLFEMQSHCGGLVYRRR
jgi:chemotaxis protein methyltransferase CheR